MINGKTSSGFEFALDAASLDNMELIDTLAEMQDNYDPIAISRICLLLLGKDARTQLYDHIRKEDGRVPVEDLSREIVDIFAEMGDKGKN